MKNYIYLLICILFISSYSSAQSPAYQEMLKGMYSYTVPQIKPGTAQEWMQKERVYVLDAREKAEYDASHIQQSIPVGYDHFVLSSVVDVPKNAKIVVYCSVGYRSERIGEQLIKAGYSQVYNLYGGIFEWVNEGYPVYDAKGPTTKVHAYDKNWGKWVENKDVQKVY